MLSLNPRTVWVDVDEFSNLHALSRQQRAARMQDAGGTLALYDRAFNLYRGDFLPGDIYHDWSGGLRDHLKDMHHDMLRHAADLTDAAGSRDAAAAYYEKMFSMDPCNEKACRWLMTNCLAAGQRTEAIRLYERCQLALRKDLDIEPDDQTRRLYRSIVGG
jgi:DNA-binding SARP family transcriptional activator